MKSDVREGFFVYFDEFRGEESLRYDLYDVMGSFVCTQLALLDEIFYPMFSYYGEYSTADLGFVNLYR